MTMEDQQIQAIIDRVMREIGGEGAPAHQPALPKRTTDGYDAAPAPAQQGQPAPSPNNGAEAFPSAPKALDVLDMNIEQYRAQRDRFKGTSLI